MYANTAKSRYMYNTGSALDCMVSVLHVDSFVLYTQSCISDTTVLNFTLIPIFHALQRINH